MSTTAITITSERSAVLARVADYVELTKPRIGAMVLVTVGVAAFVAGWGPPSVWLLANTLVGTALVAASASALNQWIERESDAHMPRTAGRPLPAGRLNAAQVLAFSVVTIVAGTLQLALIVNMRTAAFGLLTWALYVWVYTPLKRRTSANTAIGAIAGAMPVLMGWSATGAALDLRAWSLFLILFIWQFPHFMAIAWLYRRQYGEAGLKMLTTVDPSGFRAAAQAVVSALVLIPVSLVPCLSQPAGGVYFGWALLLGSLQLACAVAFFVQLSELSARRLLLASLVYLPAMMALLVIGPLA
ncbi:MAG TPA: heme o synthase [Pirellulales bacterium]|jgi:protoheme IX farnesyltransferase|nr:heme o synthase [Pirellulales bacterium]